MTSKRTFDPDSDKFVQCLSFHTIMLQYWILVSNNVSLLIDSSKLSLTVAFKTKYSHFLVFSCDAEELLHTMNYFALFMLVVILKKQI